MRVIIIEFDSFFNSSREVAASRSIAEAILTEMNYEKVTENHWRNKKAEVDAYLEEKEVREQ